MFALVRKSIAFIDSGFHIEVSPYPKGEDPARGLLAGAGNLAGMAADSRGEGHRSCREEGQEKRAVQSVERDCLALLAEGRDMNESACGIMWLPGLRPPQDYCAASVSRRRVSGACGRTASGYKSRAGKGCPEPPSNLILISTVVTAAP